MSATHTEKQANDSDTDDIVAEVRRYLAALPKKDGLEIAINEGEQIAAIINHLDCPPILLRPSMLTRYFAKTFSSLMTYKTMS